MARMYLQLGSCLKVALLDVSLVLLDCGFGKMGEEANVVGPFYAQVVSRGPRAMQAYVEFRRDPNGNPEPWPWMDEQ